MAKFFLSIILILMSTMPSWSAANNVSDEFHRLRGIGCNQLIQLGMEHIKKNQSDSALVCFYAVANRYYTRQYENKDLPYIIKALEDIGVVYMTYAIDYQKSYDNLLEARELAEKNNITESLPNIYNCIANILQMTKRKGSADDEREVREMLKKAFYAAAKTGDRSTMALVIGNLLSTSEWKNSKSAGIEKEIAIFRRLCSKDNTTQARQSIMLCNAYMAIRNGNDMKGISIIESAVKTKDNYPLAYRSVITSMNIIAKIYTNRKDYGKAIETVKKSLDIAKQNNSTDFESSIYSELAKIYSLTGDSLSAQRYELLHLRTKERLITEGNLSSARNAKFMRELNKANEQVKELSEKRRQQSIMLTCAIIVLAIIAILLWRIYKANKKIRQNYKHLYRSNVELLAKENQARLLKTEAEEKIKTLENHIAENGNSMPTAASKDKPTYNASEQQTGKYKGSRLTQEDTKELYATILKTMESSEEIFRIGFNIDRLSELVHSRSRYVSQAINQESGSNFNTLLNEYRIKEACRRLSGNPDYANMTIEAIAESVGFKSRTSFGALFKTMTGLSPSAYQKMACLELRMKNEE